MFSVSGGAADVSIAYAKCFSSAATTFHDFKTTELAELRADLGMEFEERVGVLASCCCCLRGVKRCRASGPVLGLLTTRPCEVPNTKNPSRRPAARGFSRGPVNTRALATSDIDFQKSDSSKNKQSKGEQRKRRQRVFENNHIQIGGLVRWVYDQRAQPARAVHSRGTEARRR